jgi:hypothetical protein
MFLQTLGLPPTTTAATIRTKLNGHPLEWETKNKAVGKNGAWKLGTEVEKKEGGDFQWTTWTVENGRHVFNFTCLIRADGTVVNGTVNCFGLGSIDIDQEYVDEYLSNYKDNGPPVWEKITL